MATADQLKALIRTHSEGDETRFYSVALQLAAHAARTGKTKLAQELRAVIEEARAKAKITPIVARIKPTPLVQPKGELVGLLSVSYPQARIADMVLDGTVRKLIARALVEQRQRHRIRDHGLAPIRRLLLTGPPGTGKTMTASVLAGELSLPLFMIRLDGLITKFMGETASKLRLVFDAIQQTRGVYLFDEFDALGGQRTTKNDVGEIRRVLNSFLQFLEQDESDSIIVAATNHPALLDPALFRRFDQVIAYQLPTADLATAVLKNRLALFGGKSLDWDTVTQESRGLNHGELVRAAEQAAKNAILQNQPMVTTEALVESLRERRVEHQE